MPRFVRRKEKRSKKAVITIGKNINALMTERRLSQGSNALSKVFERLSSGMRINRASDDAAGLSIASDLNARSKVFGQGIRNVNDGISALNIADGALSSLGDVTIRLKELAEQAANGTYSAQQRSALNAEAQALSQEFNRIVDSTSFNGQQLLDGSISTFRVQQSYGVQGSTEVSTSSSLQRNVGSGAFADPQGSFSGSSSFGSETLVLADFNGDGKVDIANLAGGSSADSGVDILISDGAGNLSGIGTVDFGSELHDHLKVGDFNGDGKADLLLFSEVNYAVYPAGFIAFGNGNGTFRAPQTVINGGKFENALVADLNGDGKSDAVLGATGSLIVQFGATAGFSGGTQITPSGLGTINSLVAGDVNGDGKVDLAITSGTTAWVLTGNGNGTFRKTRTFSVAANSTINMGDFNGDSQQDLLVNTGGTLLMYAGNGDGSFAAPITTVGSGQLQTLMADLNDDGIQDLIVTGVNGYSTFLGSLAGTFTRHDSLALNNPDSYPFSPKTLAVGDLNGDGVNDIVSSQFYYPSTVEYGIATKSTHIEAINLTTAASARTALTRLDSTLNRIQAQRSGIGRDQKRLDVSINTLTAQKLGSEQARSRIMDADIAADAAESIRLQILQEAAASVLSQTKQSPQIALKLLTGN